MTTATQRKRALITGITGQDGSYLADLLLALGDRRLLQPLLDAAPEATPGLTRYRQQHAVDLAAAR